MIEDWLAPDPVKGFRITEIRNRKSRHGCYVCVETLKKEGPVSMYFFRHQDGLWRIFPPALERPAMRVTGFSTND
ncbi:hypothetical protein AB4Y38_07630 [Paraburkholderia sp. EG285A]|uniref:hypothetical protein n=1 Tax=Paraburkholderia sp. EG285A TaxID=3237009 RepID=UPI0034D3368B